MPGLVPGIHVLAEERRGWPGQARPDNAAVFEPLNLPPRRGLNGLVVAPYRPASPTRQSSLDGPQVFRSLSVGARVQPRELGAQSGRVRGGGGGGVDHHRPLRFPGAEAGPSTFFGGLAIAGLSILFGLAGFAAIWQNGSRGMARILLAFLIDGAILAYPAYLACNIASCRRSTTSHRPDRPAALRRLARLRTGEGTNPAVYAGLYSAEQQRRFYPDVEPVELEISVDRAYAIALQLVHKRKWIVIDERAPQPPRRIGRIEAVARTPIMGFREDISIRFVADGDDSRVDIRSASRNFDSDLGSNAARIKKFIDDLNTAADADALKPVKKTPVAPPKAPAKTVKK